MRHLYPTVPQNSSSSLLLRNGWSIVMIGHLMLLESILATNRSEPVVAAKFQKAFGYCFRLLPRISELLSACFCLSDVLVLSDWSCVLAAGPGLWQPPLGFWQRKAIFG